MRLWKRYIGRPERHVSNPAEKAWSRFWQEANCSYPGREAPLGNRCIDNLLNDYSGWNPNHHVATPKDLAVAAKVLQWLGTPVGAYKLREFLMSPAGEPIRKELHIEGMTI